MQLIAYTFQIGHGLLGLVILVLDVLALVGLLKGNASTIHKVVWIIVILLFPFVGVLLYYLIGRSRWDA